jgi:hypothetical protein
MKMTLRKVHGKVLRRIPCAAAALAGLLAFSCQLPSSSGLHGIFTQASTAYTSIQVSDPGMPLRLIGSVQVTTGGLRVWVTPPQGPNAYDQSFSVVLTYIDQTFMSPAVGTWTLSINSLAGSGRYDLTIGN